MAVRLRPSGQRVAPQKLLTLHRESTNRLALLEAGLQLTCGSSCVVWVSLPLGGTGNNPIWGHCFDLDAVPTDPPTFPADLSPVVATQTNHGTGFQAMQRRGVHYLTYSSRASSADPFLLHVDKHDCPSELLTREAGETLVSGLSDSSKYEPGLCWLDDGDDARGPFLLWQEQNATPGLWEDYWGPGPLLGAKGYRPQCTADGDTVVVSRRAGTSRIFPSLSYTRLGESPPDDPWQTLSVAMPDNTEASLDFTMALVGNQLMMFWQSDQLWPPQIQHCRVSVGSNASCTPEVITDGVPDASYPAAVATDDGVGLVFFGVLDGRKRLYYRHFPVN